MSFGAAYLQRDPRHLTASPNPWGRHTVCLHLAGSDYVFTGLSTPQSAAVERRYAHHLRDAAPRLCGSIRTEVHRAAPADFVPVETAGWVYGLAFDYRSATVELAGPHFAGQLHLGSHLHGSLQTSHNDTFVSHGTFENYLRVLLAYRLLEHGGVLLHSAGVVDDGGAYLFFGRSGAGKTTVSRLSLTTGRQILSDDMNCVRPVQGGQVVEPLPFAGDLANVSVSANAYPLHALSCLEKSSQPELEPLPPSRAVAALLACTPFVNRDPYRSECLMSNLESLLAQTPARRLRFARDPHFWDLLSAKARETNVTS